MGQIWSEPNSNLSALVQVYSNLGVQTREDVLMHNCTVLYTLVFSSFGNNACNVVVATLPACCAGPECCFCLHPFVLVSIIAGDYCSPVSILKCSEQMVSFVFHLPICMLHH